jgi:hypothetical protein
MLNVAKELSALERLTVGELRERYVELFREPTRSHNRKWMIRRIIWRMQSLEEGGLSECARQRAMELANGADLRLTPPLEPKCAPNADERTKTVALKLPVGTDLLPGTALKREYKGRTVRVTVLADGFEYEGERYRSLTAVAKVVTGKHWNGFHFFGLRQKGGAR